MIRIQTASAIPFRLSLLLVLFSLAIICPADGSEQAEPPLTLQRTIDSAIQANMGLKISRSDSEAAEHQKNAQKTQFLPKVSLYYDYTRHDAERQVLGALTRPKDEYTFQASITQPLFAGFSILNQYKISELGLDVARWNEARERQRIVFEAQKVYFSVLRTQKIVGVSQQAVESLEANLKVSKDFFEVGMIPYNDLLKSEVELANARQDLIVAKNSLDVERANFNTLLRQPINAPVRLVDLVDYTPYETDLESCLSTAGEHRPEVRIAEFQVEIAEKEMSLARKDFFPTINLVGSYFRQGRQFSTDGGEGITDPDGWDISATATWDIWQWGATEQGVREKLSRHSRAKYEKTQALDNIQLEVKRAYLATKDLESNIAAVDKAVAQAKENLRITADRYKEQMATTRDVLDAQTLLSKTMTNYYSALYNFQIAKAALHRAMGLGNEE